MDAVEHLRRSDPVLASVIETVGFRHDLSREPTFETLARAIVFLQLNGKAARTIWQRLVDAAGGEPLAPEALLKLRMRRRPHASEGHRRVDGAHVPDLRLAPPRRAADG